jgi:hypothetical protein
MREKYIEERHPRWFSMDRKGVDIDDMYGFIGQAANEHEATAIMDRHNELIDAFTKLVQAFEAADQPAFKRYWYDT